MRLSCPRWTRTTITGSKDPSQYVVPVSLRVEARATPRDAVQAAPSERAHNRSGLTQFVTHGSGLSLALAAAFCLAVSACGKDPVAPPVQGKTCSISQTVIVDGHPATLTAYYSGAKADSLRAAGLCK